MRRSGDALASSPCKRGSIPRILALSVAALLLGACATKQPPPSKPAPAKPVAKPAAKPAQPPAAAWPTLPKPPDKGDPAKRFEEALALMQGNDVENAELAFRSLTEDFPGFSGPFTNLGIIYAKSNRKELALAALSKAATLNPSNTTALNWLGILYRDARDYLRAERAYQNVLRLDPNNALAHLNLGILYDDALKRPAAALPHYKEYQRLAGKEDLRVLAWIAEIEASQKTAAPPAPKPATTPAPAKPAPAPAQQAPLSGLAAPAKRAEPQR